MHRVAIVLSVALAATKALAQGQGPREVAALKGHAEAAFHLAFSPDGKLLASCGEPCVKVWDLESRREIVALRAPEGTIWGRSVAFAPDGKTLVYLFDDGVVRLWDVAAQGESAVVGTIDSGWGGVTFLSDGRLLAYSRGRATLVDPKARAPLSVLNGPANSFYAAALTPNGKDLVAAGHDGKVRIWDVEGQRLRAVLDGHRGIVWALAVSADGKVAASGGEDGTIKSWDVQTGELLATVGAHRGRVTSLAFTPDGKVLASTGNDGRLRLWDTRTHEGTLTMTVPGETVRGVAFTRDGRTMATGNVDGTIRLWELPTRDTVHVRDMPRRDVLKGSLAHSPEDHLRITGKARVIDGNTIAFEDGVEVDISGGMDAPELKQMGLRDGAPYPCGEEAAAFLRNMIGENSVTCYINTKHGMPQGRDRRLRGPCLVGESRVDEAMVLGGWAVSDHSQYNALEIIARENGRGLWRGQFVAPKEWRKGARLPGEPPAPRPEDLGAKAIQAPAAPTVVKEGDRVVKVVGTAEVLDAHTLRFADGTLVELNGGMDAPDIEQLAAVGDGLYAWGRDAADFLRARIGGGVVTCHVGGWQGDKLRADCYVDEAQLQVEMVRHGWAVSHHSGMDGYEMFARGGHRGVWRGRFVRPEDWRRGDRLPGEPGETAVQLEALRALARFEPVVQYDESRPGRTVVAIQFHPNTSEKPGDDDLARLKVFTNLRSLDLPSASKVTDAGLKHLAGLKGLVELNVNWTGVTAEGVVRLVSGRLGMDRLEISGVPFRDEDLAAMRGIPDLRALSLRATRITDAGLAQLRRFEKLRSLSLMSTNVTDAGLAHLETLTDLEDLDLDRTAVTDAGLAHLRGLVRLRRLQVAHTRVTDAGLRHLEDLPDLRGLKVRGTAVTKEAVDRFLTRPRLEARPSRGPE
jgi:endonuclease YncB( thermonuclease family)